MDQQTNRPLKMNAVMHALLTAVVGAYLLYIAYRLFSSASSDGMPMALSIAFGALFALGGVGVLVYAYRIWKQDKAAQQAAQSEDADDDDDEGDADDANDADKLPEPPEAPNATADESEEKPEN